MALVHLKGLGPSVGTLARLAGELSEGFSGSDMKRAMDEAKTVMFRRRVAAMRTNNRGNKTEREITGEDVKEAFRVIKPVKRE